MGEVLPKLEDVREKNGPVLYVGVKEKGISSADFGKDRFCEPEPCCG